MSTKAPPLPLKDIHLPAEPSVWPLAPGWWLVIALSVIIAIVAVVLCHQWLQKRRLQKQRQQRLFSALDSIKTQFQQTKNQHLLAADASALLRRMMLHELKNDTDVTRTGDDWLSAVSNSTGVDLTAHRQALLEAPYNPALSFESASLLNALERVCQTVSKQPNKQVGRDV